MPQAIEAIPNAAVDGILIFVGLAGAMDTQLWGRLKLLVTDASSFPPNLRYCNAALKPSKVRIFTWFQLGALGFAWLLNGLAMGMPKLAPLGLCFPFVVAMLVPLRSKLLPKFFTESELESLDSGEHLDEVLESLPAIRSHHSLDSVDKAYSCD